MLFGKYHFSCHLNSEAILPPYKGSTFRGVFGIALKRVVCTLLKENCGSCLLRRRCIYTSVFESLPEEKRNGETRISSSPHPFVIEPPLTPQTQFKAGDSFDFTLLLFGEANLNLPYFIYAFEQMGKIGIGKRVNGKRGLFLLQEVKHGEQQIYSPKDRDFKTEVLPGSLILADPGDFPSGTFQGKVNIVTPLRLKFQNHLKADLPFHVLVRAMLRRSSSLLSFHGNGEPDLDYRGLIKKAEQVRVARDDLAWFEWERYSNRQERAMLMGGMVGSITYEGELQEFMPFIAFSSQVHLGKQTSFGLGKIDFELQT